MLNGIGTDAMAVACILGSAGLAGAVTFVATAGGDDGGVCAVETATSHSRIRIEEARHRAERARVRIEARKAHLHTLDLRGLEPAMQELDHRIEMELERELERLDEELSRPSGR